MTLDEIKAAAEQTLALADRLASDASIYDTIAEMIELPDHVAGEPASVVAARTCARAALALVELAPLLDDLLDEYEGDIDNPSYSDMSAPQTAAAWRRIRAALKGEG